MSDKAVPLDWRYDHQRRGPERFSDMIDNPLHYSDAELADLDPLADEPVSELGYARRLIFTFTGTGSGTWPAWRRWLVWDGQALAARHDRSGCAVDGQKVVARRVTDDAMELQGERERTAALNVARRGESVGQGPRRAGPGQDRGRGSSSLPTTWTPTRSCSTAPTGRWICGPGSCASTIPPTCSRR